jgi:CRISPR type IV-associated DEAD/DEAH-box helicase Csf4
MATLIEALEPICTKPRRSKRQPSAEELAPAQRKALELVQRYLAVLKDVTAVKDWTSRGVLSLSPIRHYVNLTFGPSTVARHLAARWHVTPCAMHFSGSLYHISSTGPNARFAAATVSATDRMAQTGSYMPSWLTTSPTLHLPGPERLHMLMPPPRDGATPTAMRYWLENVGAAIALAAKDAAGGTLVLMTGYERLNLLAEVIRDLHPDLAGARLVVQNPSTGVSSCADDFTRKAKEGLRPIWLATGGAWTGLDLTDDKVPADKDQLLTDLIIPGIPFGLDQNTTHMDRLRRMGFVAEIMVAQRKLRQGLGRLIRREGVQNRRIWMLDARVLNPTTAHRFADLRLVLQQYLQTERF